MSGISQIILAVIGFCLIGIVYVIVWSLIAGSSSLLVYGLLFVECIDICFLPLRAN